eukprot:scaffold114424_cov20-Tisochrysis_lutea.AAC.2
MSPRSHPKATTEASPASPGLHQLVQQKHGSCTSLAQAKASNSKSAQPATPPSSPGPQVSCAMVHSCYSLSGRASGGRANQRPHSIFPVQHVKPTAQLGAPAQGAIAALLSSANPGRATSQPLFHGVR